jgi:AraC-like DNA-binding protein
MTASRTFQIASGTHITGLRFRPGQTPGLPAVELVDRIVPLADIYNVSGLHQRLDDAPEPAAVLSAWLAAHIEPPTPVQLALTYLEEGRDLGQIARNANLSVRQFRRRCAELTGLSPRHLARILRFRKACGLAGQTPRPDWAGIALNAGYYDQAHLIRDFHEFAGAAPMAVFSNTGTPASH